MELVGTVISSAAIKLVSEAINNYRERRQEARREVVEGSNQVSEIKDQWDEVRRRQHGHRGGARRQLRRWSNMGIRQGAVALERPGSRWSRSC
jgi:hypothetical protein